MDIEQDIRTLEEFERQPSHLIRKVRNNGRPMLITSKGKPGVVIIPAEMLKDKLKALTAACELAQV